MKAPGWWPPKVGDHLRGMWGPDPDKDPLLHVIAVFRHDGDTLIATAEWSYERQRWSREIQDVVKAHVGLIRPDGAPRK